MPAKYIYKPNQTRADSLLVEKAGLVNKMLILPPFSTDCATADQIVIILNILNTACNVLIIIYLFQILQY